MFTSKTIKKLESIQTPFYYYDLGLLTQTLKILLSESAKYNFKIHYALKANSNNQILNAIKLFNVGADCVSGNEIKKAIENNFAPQDIVFAGVGKNDAEINYALEKNISCFNCECLQELQVINQLAFAKNKIATIALRINPNVNANTHKYITTGLEENKFGINLWELDSVFSALPTLKNLQLKGLHFHIGSQITDLSSFKNLCVRINQIQTLFLNHHLKIEIINVGGGLGVDYHLPDSNCFADFAAYFKLFSDFLELQPNQKVHFELGRAIVAQCGALIARVLYIKKGVNTNFAILDAGMTELLRPALYQAFHKIENISNSQNPTRSSAHYKYDVVGPVCESADCFGKAVNLPETLRGDLIAIRTTGAYGEVMCSEYNLRERVKAVYQ